MVMESAHMAPADDDVSPSSTGLSGDAALVVGLAATAMPFAHTAEDQAESWLRTLRLHGSVGTALSALGMSEEQLLSRSVPKSQSVGTPVPEGDVIERVVRSATEFTIARGGEVAGTGDLLFALFDVYGRIMDRALFMHGITRSQVFDALAAGSREQTL
jgi:hypothetical protein